LKALYILIALAALVASSFAQTWYTNPANGHQYTLVTGIGWTDCQNQAIQLGGTLAAVNDAQENQWILDTVYQNYGEHRSWIGLYKYNGWRWVTGEPLDYTNWAPGQPDSATIYELFGEMYIGYNSGSFPPGTWNDNADTIGNVLKGVVEVVPEPATIGTMAFGLALIARRFSTRISRLGVNRRR